VFIFEHSLASPWQANNACSRRCVWFMTRFVACGLWLDLRVNVLTDVENNGTQGFIQVQTFMRIKTYVLCASVYYNSLGRDPLYPVFYRLRGVWFIRKIRVSYSCTRLRLYLYLSILQDSSNDYLLSTSVMAPLAWILRSSGSTHSGPLFLSSESRYQTSLAAHKCLANEI
jgi:hypothetical protein